jgi:hypothetical protein
MGVGLCVSVGLCLSLGLGLLGLLKSLGGRAHAREREKGVHSFRLGYCWAFLGEMARQAVESTTGEMLAASVHGGEKMISCEARTTAKATRQNNREKITKNKAGGERGRAKEWSAGDLTHALQVCG